MKRGFFQILLANVIGLVISLITNFVMPKWLSMESYAMYKTYALYISYAGFFSLGYNDGMYLKYGGKDMEAIDKIELSSDFVTYSIMIFLLGLITFFVGIVTANEILLPFAIGIVTYNILGYLKSLYQATGEFGSYSRAQNIEKISIFISLILLVYWVKTDDYNAYIWSQVVIGVLVMLLLVILLQHKVHFIRTFTFRYEIFKENIGSGFVLMIGNFTNIIFTGLDRWFVKFLLSSSDFAVYSFAVSIENLINVFITPITIMLYNYFCRIREKNKVVELKNMVILFGYVLISAAFPICGVVKIYISKYNGAQDIIFILFLSHLYILIILAIYVNLYKARKMQKVYSRQMLLMIGVGIALNFVLFKLFHNCEGIAVATLVTSAIWFCLCEIKHKDFGMNLRTIVYMILMTLGYLVCGFYMSRIMGFIIYITIFIFSSLVFMKETLINAYRLGMDVIGGYVNKRG